MTTQPVEELKDLLTTLNVDRKDLLETSNKRKAMLQAVTESKEYIELQEKEKRIEEYISNTEARIKEAALVHYALTDEKKVHPFVTVKVFKEFRVLDESVLREWVRTNLADALVVDQAKVKQYAKSIGPVDGTVVVDVPKAQIASVLE